MGFKKINAKSKRAGRRWQMTRLLLCKQKTLLRQEGFLGDVLSI
jgi:hypothetical protein